MLLPTRLRRVQVAAMPDADWAATQVAPAASICADVSTTKRLGAVFVAYNAAGAVVNPSGTMSVALVDVADTLPRPGETAGTLIKTSPIDTAVAAGAGLEYDVSASRRVTIRVAAQALAGGVAYVDIFWNSLE